tara:strand:- start:1959 stop:2126 length:168 start_codon:yes stop_codon:yes gene_type:complete
VFGGKFAPDYTRDFSAILKKHHRNDNYGSKKGECKKTGDSDTKHDITSSVLSMST